MEVIRIENFSNYTQEFQDDVLILKPKKKSISLDEIVKKDLSFSKILSCKICNAEEVVTSKTKFNSILVDVWKSMPAQKVLQNTNYNFKIQEYNEKGYHWNKELRMSVQYKCSNDAMKEIINMARLNHFSLNIEIEIPDEGVYIVQ